MKLITSSIMMAMFAATVLAQPYNGSISGSLTFTAGYSTTSGVTGFNLTNYITIPHQALLRSSGTPGAYSARVKYTSCTKLDVILSNSDGTAWWGVTSTGQLQYSGPGHGSVIGGSGLCDGNVHEIALSSTGSDLRMYIDGTQAGTTASGTWGAITNTAAGYIGTHPGSLGGYNFTGLLDEVGIWNTNKFPAAYTPTGVAVPNNNPGLVVLYHLETNVTYSAVPGSGPTAGTPVAGTVTTTTIQVNGGTITGGTPAYSSQLQKAPVPFPGTCGTFVNIGSPVVGATPSWTDTGLSSGTSHCYRYIVTDSLSASATSSNVIITTGTASLYTRYDPLGPRGGQQMMILTPGSSAAIPYTGSPTDAIIYFHGAGEASDALVNSGGQAYPLNDKASIVTAALNAGYILAGTNARGDNWGTLTATWDYADLYQHMRTNFNIRNVIIFCQSMGCLTAANALSQGMIPNVRGFVAIYGVFSLANLHGLGIYTTTINTQHGVTGTGTATYANMTYGLDPLLIAPTYPSNYRFVRMRFYASPSDTVVPTAQNTDAFRTITAPYSLESVKVVTSGEHGDASNFQSSDFIAFCNRALTSPAFVLSGGVQ